MTKDELKKYNGENGMPSYVAYKGKVYDVSDSGMWVGGDHMGEHTAGTDLTDELEDAPHDDRVLEKFKIVGDLEE